MRPAGVCNSRGYAIPSPHRRFRRPKGLQTRICSTISRRSAPRRQAVPAGYTSTNPSVQEAELEITAASATQLRNQQAANAAAIDSDVPAPAPASTLTIPVWVWVAVAGVAAFALVGLGGGSARRYGR